MWLFLESLNCSVLVITISTSHFSVTNIKYFKLKEIFHWIHVAHLNYPCTWRTLLSHSSPDKLQLLLLPLQSPQSLNPSLPATPLTSDLICCDAWI